MVRKDRKRETKQVFKQARVEEVEVSQHKVRTKWWKLASQGEGEGEGEVPAVPSQDVARGKILFHPRPAHGGLDTILVKVKPFYLLINFSLLNFFLLVILIHENNFKFI